MIAPADPLDKPADADASNRLESNDRHTVLFDQWSIILHGLKEYSPPNWGMFADNTIERVAEDPECDPFPDEYAAGDITLGALSRAILDTTDRLWFPPRRATIAASMVSRIVSLLASGEFNGQAFLGHCPSIPVGCVGPIMVMGHFNPWHSCTDVFPADLVYPVWLRPSDYFKMLHSLQDSLRTFLTGGMLPGGEARADSSIVPFESFRTSDAAGEDWIKALRWASKLPTTKNDDSMMEVLNSPNPEEARLPEPYQIFLGWLLRKEKFLPAENLRTSPAVMPTVPKSLWERYEAAPTCCDGESIWMAVKRLGDLRLEDELSGFVSFSALVKFRVPGEAYYRMRSSVVDNRADDEEEHQLLVEDRLAFEAERQEFTGFDPANEQEPHKLVRFIFTEAIERGASDIHIERYKNRLRVRLAVEGKGEQFLLLAPDKYDGVASLVKQFSSMRLDGHDHQEGRFSFRANNRMFDVRASLIFDQRKEPKFTLRPHDKKHGVRPIGELGMSLAEVLRLRQCFLLPHGLFVISGPTGSGKTTTLNSILRELNDLSRFIYSLEDPVEYEQDGITQINATSNPIKLKAGVPSFAHMITLLLRADPDVILVGEIRDQETAEASLQAAMTGHLVLSTVHANDSITTISRLIDLGADPSALSDTLVATIAQRLIRRVCPQCHMHGNVSDKLDFFKTYGITPEQQQFSYPIAVGCEACSEKGYRGRLPVLEMLSPKNESDLRNLIRSKAKYSDILAAARQEGSFHTLMEVGLMKVLAGLTTIEEVSRVCARID
jgi:type II secretory ATPase GspE/PulE/Tfp pilus assembly ATPase PilB-like protein